MRWTHRDLLNWDSELLPLPNVISLNLSANNLEKLPDKLFKLTSLQSFYCSHNQLTVLPTEIGLLSQLQTFDCSHNQLTVFPTEINQLIQLRTFNWSHNQITRTFSGKDFNIKYANYSFVKLTTQDECHNGFQFKTGLNIDTIEFNPIGDCCPGGLYFTDLNVKDKWFKYGNKTMIWERKVIIPDDALVYVELHKFKSDKFILEERSKINQ